MVREHNVLMEHPPKQGLKHNAIEKQRRRLFVLMEHPPKQGLKQKYFATSWLVGNGFNGTSTKTRIETLRSRVQSPLQSACFNGTSTKTRIETECRRR